MPARWRVGIVGISLAMVLAGGPVPAGERLAGPIPAQVISVLDGDTVEVRARVWLGHEVRTRVRLDGIDAPELRGQCLRERRLAARARDFLTSRLLSGAQTVLLREVRHGKFAGRVLARLETAEGRDLGRDLVDAGLAVPYDGRTRPTWCAQAGEPGAPATDG